MGSAKIKIAVISSGHIPSQWAHSINTMKMANAFSKLGHNVEVLTVERYLERKNKQRIKDIYKFYGISKNIKILYFRDNFLFYLEEMKPFNWILWILKKITKNRIRYIFDPENQISEYCKKNNVDICYCRSYRTVFYNIKNKIPSIMESHTPNIKHPDLQRVIKLSHSKYFKGLVTISDILKQNFMKAGIPKDKILVLQDGVDIESFQNIKKTEARANLGLPQDKSIIMYCGHLYKGRGIEYILDAAKILKDKNVMFAIVGGFPSDVSYWKKYANDMGLVNVVFTGFVENGMVPTYLKAADVLLMPYTRDTPTYKWMSPLKLFEYMAAGQPIIATDLVAIKERIENLKTGILVKEKSGKEIANAVRLILDNRVLANKLSRNAAKEVEKYSLRKRAEAILNKFVSENNSYRKK